MSLRSARNLSMVLLFLVSIWAGRVTVAASPGDFEEFISTFSCSYTDWTNPNGCLYDEFTAWCGWTEQSELFCDAAEAACNDYCDIWHDTSGTVQTCYIGGNFSYVDCTCNYLCIPG